MSTQDLAVYSNGALPAPIINNFSTGLEDVRVTPTFLKIITNKTQSPGDAKPSQILDTLTGEVYDSLVLVPLRVSRPRTLFPPGAPISFDTKPLCKSADGVVPSPYAEQPQSKSCASCPHAQWKGDKASECKSSYEFLVIVKETTLPRKIQFGGLGATAAGMLLKQIKQHCIKEAASKTNPRTLQLFDFYFTLTVDKQNGKFGPVYVPRFKDVKVVNDPAQFGALFEEYVVRQRAVDEEEQVIATAQKADEAVESAVLDAVPVEI